MDTIEPAQVTEEKKPILKNILKSYLGYYLYIHSLVHQLLQKKFHIYYVAGPSR
jgi:hypothetical protein